MKGFMRGLMNIAHLIRAIVIQIVLDLPPTFLAFKIKTYVLRRCGADVGKDCQIYPGLWVSDFKKLRIGSNVHSGYRVMMTTAGGLSIEDGAMIGHGSIIITAGHIIPPNKGRIQTSGHELKEVKIKRDAWGGAGVIILPGVTIGEGAVVAAGAVVTKDVPDFVIVAGVPARVIKRR